ncbi:hypothetical protein AAGS61_08105 [Lysinibacillus sp. KU-BSD001]|uniref:hypothetical protein n=1 Tax=Lysinibacillus sp. KU-BSD001 TaxID=3141328 RepID=UPI0036E6F8DB
MAMFLQFKDQIKALPVDYTDDMLLNETFLLDKDQKKGLDIYYAPFEYVNQRAKVIIVGITPGFHQMKRSYSTVINTTGTDEEILKKVKEESSFHGSMRKNLVAMLDELKLADYLEIATTEQLFNVYHHYLQSTSVLPHAVFYKGKNYNGATPKISSNELLRKYVHTYFPKNIQGIEHALLIPLGVNVQAVVEELMRAGHIKSYPLLRGFPHPSGGNGHRLKQFTTNKEQMAEVIKRFFETAKYR